MKDREEIYHVFKIRLFTENGTRITRMDEWTNGTNEEKVIYKDISFKIVESCFEVHNILGPGYSEKIYEEAVSKELRNRGIEYERQKLIEVFYKAEKIGEYRLDMVVENKIILELKQYRNLTIPLKPSYFHI